MLNFAAVFRTAIARQQRHDSATTAPRQRDNGATTARQQRHDSATTAPRQRGRCDTTARQMRDKQPLI
ncbi:MAG: hypothetical protein IJS59_03645 [Bacteroidaceae bacterium]|nr:hypothetical protein [Bacteroidaceae bacterium]